MSSIRVTYSGLIGFVIGIISVITGMVFTLIVTRRLTPEEFGIWAIIGSMIGYFLFAEYIISYWSTRQIARGEPIGKTALVSSSIFSVAVIPIYISLALLMSKVQGEYLDTMLLATVLVPLTFVSQTLAGINLGYKPHATSFGVLAFESLKIPAGLALVFFLDLGINGAIIATMIAYFGKLLIQIYFAKEKLGGYFKTEIIRKWIKLSWITLYNNISHLIWTLDVVIFPLITASVIGVAYYAASLAVAAIIGHTSMISQALYPKLLANGSKDHVQENFVRLMYFAIPFLGIVIVFSRPALFALNPEYIIASEVVILLAFRAFFYTINTAFNNVLLGIETIDVEENPSFLKLLKSKLFFIPTLINIHYSLYIVILVIMLFIQSQNNVGDLELVKTWSWISVGLSIPFAIYSGILVKRNATFSLPLNEILKYVFSTIILIIIFIITSETMIKYEISIYDFLPGVVLQFLICSCAYIAVTYLIDNKTRILLKAIVMEIMIKK